MCFVCTVKDHIGTYGEELGACKIIIRPLGRYLY